MYASYERPTISMSICYYDTEYRRQTAECVLDILKRNQMFRPSRMDADHLTGGRMKKYTPDMEELFLRAYGEPDVLGIAWESGDYRSGKDYMGFLWSLTFLKNSSHIQSSYHPWNVLSFTLCYDWLREPAHHARLLQCTQELSAALHAFHASIDDTANEGALLRKTGEPTFLPDHIQQVYWGNYWGEHLLSQAPVDALRAFKPRNYAETGSGVFFTLTDSVFDFGSRACDQQRKRIAAMLCGRNKR